MCKECLHVGEDGFLDHILNYSYKPLVDFYHVTNHVWQKFPSLRTKVFEPDTLLKPSKWNSNSVKTKANL